jgi:chromosome segregation ATPase
VPILVSLLTSSPFPTRQVASRASNRPASAPNPATANELAELRRKSAQQLIETETLKTQLADLRRENLSMRNQHQQSTSSGLGQGPGSSGGTTAELSSLKDQISKLTSENNKLKNELSAFDLDFFEEIENLKYAHAEAVRKLKAMEKMYGPSGGGVGGRR